MHRAIRSAAAPVPLRLLLIAMLLTGLALAVEHHCTDDSPAVTAATVWHVDDAHVLAGRHSPERPGDLPGLCANVLAAITAALVLIGVRRRLGTAVNGCAASLVGWSPSQPRGPALSVLCVLRT